MHGTQLIGRNPQWKPGEPARGVWGRLNTNPGLTPPRWMISHQSSSVLQHSGNIDAASGFATCYGVKLFKVTDLSPDAKPLVYKDLIPTCYIQLLSLTRTLRTTSQQSLISYCFNYNFYHARTPSSGCLCGLDAAARHLTGHRQRPQTFQAYQGPHKLCRHQPERI